MITEVFSGKSGTGDERANGKRLLIAALSFCLMLGSVSGQAGECAAKKKRRYSTTAGSSGPGGVILQTPPPGNPLEHNNRAVELGSKGLWADAIREHEIALNGDPENPTFRMNLSSAQLHYADVLAHKKKWYEAITHYREALYADPNNLPADHNLDECLRAMGKNPDDYNVRAGLADEADVSGNYPVAIVEYRKCVKMRDNGPSRFHLGRVLYKQGKMVEAYDEMRTAINKDWADSEKQELSQCHATMGDILWEVTLKAKQDGRGPVYMKRLYNVAQCYRRAATINPNNSDAISGLLKACKEALSIQDSFNNNLMIAGAYVLAGDFERAKAAYNKCWTLDPNNPVLHKARIAFHMAVVCSPLASPKLVQESVSKIEKELEKRPDDAELLYIYGRGQEALKNNDLALRAYEKARSINQYINPDLMQGISRLTGRPLEGTTQLASRPGGPQSPGNSQPNSPANGTPNNQNGQAPPAPPPPKPPRVDPALYESIKTKIASGNAPQAEQELTDMVDKLPDEGQAWYLLGMAQEQQSKDAQAKTSYRMAKGLGVKEAADALRQIDSSRVNTFMEKATEYFKANDYVKASNAVKQAILMAPELPAPHRLLADILDKLGDKKEAERERKKADDLAK